jgi:hypothetical protein
MRRKPHSTSGAQVHAVGRAQHSLGAARPPNARPRLRSNDAPAEQRRRKSAPWGPIGCGAAAIEPRLQILDDMPQAIPLARRELDVIETYLGTLLDDVLGRPE